MLRLAPPLILLAALAAGSAHAQGGDRYGPPAGAPGYGSAAPVPAPALRGASAASGAPALRTLSWPGKTELRAAAGPAADVPAASVPYASGPQRFPGMGIYAVPAPALRTGASSAPRSVRAAYARPSRAARRSAADATWAGAPSAPPPAYAQASTVPGYGRTDLRAPAAAAPAWPAGAPVASAPAAPVPVYGASTLPTGLAAPPGYVPPGPATLPQLAARAEAAAPPTPDSLPPPTVGRYGYVGPGRTAAAPSAPIPAAAISAAASPASGVAPIGLGPPRPPAYARAYVMTPAAADPAQAAAQASQGAAQAAAARAGDGGRRYSLHREYGMEPDPVPVPPQFFGATADLSAPETAPAALRTKAAVNAARLAATDQ